VNGRASAGGFTYIGLLVAVVLIGTALAAVGQVWATQGRREREAELLYRGDAIRQAIASYVYGPGGSGQFPQDLKDLVKDERAGKVARFLRRLYADPMTGEPDWTIIRSPDGGIMGVASSSKGVPIKVREFSTADESFKDAQCYCDWQFIFTPKVRRSFR